MTAELLTPLPVGRKPRRDDVFEVVVTAIDGRGARIGRWADFRVRLRDGVIGARVRAVVTKRRGQRIDARVLEAVEPSADAVDPRCVHFASCGGCSFQDQAYEAQLDALTDLAERELEPLRSLGVDAPLERALPCASVYRYRNKMDFTFGARRWLEPEDVDDDRPTDFALGLHSPGRFDKVLDVRRCEIQFEGGDALLATFRRLALEHGVPPWDTATRTGVLRHLVLRRGARTGETMTYLVVSEDTPEVDALARAAVEEHPELTTLVVGVNARPATVAIGDTERVVHGPGRIREELGGVTFSISPSSFFQTNTAQAEVLVELVREAAGLTPEQRLLDLYCGAGTFALTLARDAREVVGYERVESAVRDAQANARAAGIDNARFVTGEVQHTLLADEPRPDVVVVDPPRVGLHKDVPPVLDAVAPPRIVYVSCNPKSAARDVAALVPSYDVNRIRAVDLFPHTPHVELVLTLDRRSAR